MVNATRHIQHVLISESYQAYVQIYLDFGAIHFKFNDRVKQRPIGFQRATLMTAQGGEHFCALG
jgi:hypothetical protein